MSKITKLHLNLSKLFMPRISLLQTHLCTGHDVYDRRLETYFTRDV